ncbi:MAG TPA: hypothetical protein VLG74_08425 [Blastocatellia bacterium]|nr:hypothetical protein [Blastocatellia bacterium]
MQAFIHSLSRLASAVGKHCAFGFAAAVASTSTFAQAPSGDTCLKLANTIAAGYSTSFSDRQFNALRYYATCNASASASSTGVNIGYAAFSLGVKLDDAQAKAYCGKAIDAYDIQATEYNSVKIVFNQALATIDKCLEAANRGWNIKYEQVAPDSVSLNISHGGASGGRLLGIDIIPATALQCSPALPSSEVTVTATTPFATTCSRTPTTNIVDGIQLTSAADAVLNLRLADGPMPIRMAGYSSTVLQRLEQKIEAVRSEMIANFKVKLVDRQKDREYQQPEFWNSQATTHPSFTCPEKNVLVGIELDMLGMSNVRSPTRIKYICRELTP